MASSLNVESPNVHYSEKHIDVEYQYQTTSVLAEGPAGYTVRPETTELSIRTDRHVPKLGLMLAGWGGNNGSTLTAALEANKRGLEWRTRTGMQKANWYGSITQASTVLLGTDANGHDVHIPMNKLVPMVNPAVDLRSGLYCGKPGRSCGQHHRRNSLPAVSADH